MQSLRRLDVVQESEQAGANAYEAFEHYAGLALPMQLYKAFIGRSDLSGFAIVGRAGVGKTNYAYYSIKTAYMLYLCHSRGISIDDTKACWDYVTRVHGDICFGRRCEKPDGVDAKLRDFVFVGNEDIDRLTNLLEEVLAKGRKPLPVLFLDDLALKHLYQLGGRYKELYVHLKRIYQYRRAIARTVVVTAPSKDDLVSVFSDFIFVYGNSNGSESWFIRWAVLKGKVTLKYHFGEFIDTYKTFYDIAWNDVIPRRSIFAMPRWLEDMINERKRAVLLDSIRQLRSVGRNV